MKTKSLSQPQVDLIRHTKAKDPQTAQPSDYLVTWTEYHMFILSPRSKITKSRKVIFQLPA